MAKKSTDFTGKIVLITGAGAGIGRSTALAFAKRGARIAATDFRAEALDETKGAVEALGATCTTFMADVTDEAAMKRLAEDVAARAGVPDVFVNNAGVGHLGYFLESSLEHWPRVINVNLMGVVNGCYYVIPKMIAAGGARRVVIVASAAAHYPPPSLSAYAASKAAVFGFAEVLKMELTETQVGVTTVCPGITKTGIIDPSPSAAEPRVGEAQRRRMRAYYEKNGATPDEIAEAILRAVERGADLINPGPNANLLYILRRISLKLARRINYASAPAAGFRP